MTYREIERRGMIMPINMMTGEKYNIDFDITQEEFDAKKKQLLGL